MSKLVEIDPNHIVDPSMLSMMQKINMARVDQVNKLITDNIPKWKIFFMKKSKTFSRMFGVFTVIQPQPKLESDVIREKLILCKGSKDDPKQIAEVIFYVQDRRKLDEGKL